MTRRAALRSGAATFLAAAVSGRPLAAAPAVKAPSTAAYLNARIKVPKSDWRPQDAAFWKEKSKPLVTPYRFTLRDGDTVDQALASARDYAAKGGATEHPTVSGLLQLDSLLAPKKRRRDFAKAVGGIRWLHVLSKLQYHTKRIGQGSKWTGENHLELANWMRDQMEPFITHRVMHEKARIKFNAGLVKADHELSVAQLFRKGYLAPESFRGGDVGLDLVHNNLLRHYINDVITPSRFYRTERTQIEPWLWWYAHELTQRAVNVVAHDPRIVSAAAKYINDEGVIEINGNIFADAREKMGGLFSPLE